MRLPPGRSGLFAPVPTVTVELAGRWAGSAMLLLFATAVDAAPGVALLAVTLVALGANTLLLVAPRRWSRQATGLVDLAYMTVLAGTTDADVVRVAVLGVATFWVLQIPRDAAVLCLALTAAVAGIALAERDTDTAAVLLLAGLWATAATAAAARLRQTRSTVEAGLHDARLRLADELLQAEARAQLRLAADLHDGPLQLLLAARQDLEESTDPAAANAADLIARSAQELRALVRDLEPVQSPPETASRLRDWATVLADRHRFDGHVEVDERLPYVHPLAASAARELLSNAARHARARHIRVRIGGAGDTHTVLVEDDGVGFAPDASAGDGLTLLRRRIADAGGTLVIAEGDPGTRAEVVLPAR